MKKIFNNIILICLLIFITSSCATKKINFRYNCSNTKINENELIIDDTILLKADKWELDLKNKKLLFCEELLNDELKKYVSEILKESNSLQDTIIAISHDFIVTKDLEDSYENEEHYLYYYDLNSNQWICQYINDTDFGTSYSLDTFHFNREVFFSKKRNRVILKDYFNDFSIIYVIQGEDNSTKFYTTKVWDPVNFKSFITTSNYIIDRINPISYNIAKHMFLLKLDSNNK